MRESKVPEFSVAALLVLCFGLAAYLEPLYQSWPGSRTQKASPLAVALGDARRLFANHFFVKADVYFHSGFYPTVFDDNQAFNTPHMAEDSGTVAGQNHGDETGFLGKPLDWIDAFSRRFFPSSHTHLDAGGARSQSGKAVGLGDDSGVREILPWLRLSAELNPNDIQIYTVTAYWLRERMGKYAEAEEFLRDGLRENPGSYEILFELGRVFDENRHDPARARNVWQAALRRWQQSEAGKAEPNRFLLIQISSHLARLEENEGNYDQALANMEIWKSASPNPETVQERIDQLRKKSAKTQ